MKRFPGIAAAVLTVIAASAVTSSDPVAAAPAAKGAAPAAAHLSVHPSLGLLAGSIVTVSAAGLPAATTVNLIQCDVPTTTGDEGATGCSPTITPTTDSAGAFSVQPNTRDPVYRGMPFNEEDPVYCRADNCRFFVEWTDAAGVLHSINTQTMAFKGSPATIAVTPADDLVEGQKVHISGSAHGSLGQYVEIIEETCFQIIQGSGCQGALPLATLKLSNSDTYSATLAPFRYLGDGEDCTNAFYGCILTVIVLNNGGEPDDTFGVSAMGQPGVQITYGHE